MKTKTRTAVAIIAAILIINCVHISASGTEAVIESKEAHRGDIIDIEVCLKNNPGIVAAMFNLNYDTERLQLLSAQDKNLLSGGIFMICRMFYCGTAHPKRISMKTAYWLS